MDDADAQFLFALILNTALAVLFFVLFLVFRKKVSAVYEPRCTVQKYQYEKVYKLPDVTPPPAGVLAWIGSTLRYSDEKVLETHGLDVAMSFKFLSLAMSITLVQMIYGIVILIWVNYTAQGGSGSVIQRLSMSNVESGSVRLVAHLLSVVTNSLLSYNLLWRTYSTYASYRRLWKSTSSVANTTILVRDIPRTESAASLNEIFSVLFPGEVKCIIPFYLCKALEEARENYEKAVIALEKADAKFLKTGKRLRHKPGGFMSIFKGKAAEVDSIEFWTVEVDKLSKEVESLKEQYVQEKATKQSFGRACFVTFNSAASALKASSVCLTANLAQFIPSPAPEPRDINWMALTVSHYSRLIREILLVTAVFFGAVFFAIPTSFIAGLANINNLSQISGLSWLADLAKGNTLLTSFIQGYLPPLLLAVLMALVPIIIRLLAERSGLSAKSAVDVSLMAKYFVFQVINVFFVTIIAGSIFTALSTIIENPSSAVEILAKSIPLQSSFYINYVMLLSMQGHAMSLWRPVPLLLRWVFLKLGSTRRDYRNAGAPGTDPFAMNFTQHMLIFLIVTTYSTLASLITLFGFLYFCFAYLAARYNSLYVFVPEYDGGGIFWPSIFVRMCFALLLYQFTLVGVFGIYLFAPGAIVAGIFAAATVVYMVSARYHFDKFATGAPLELCVSVPPPPAVEYAYKAPYLLPLEAPESQDSSVYLSSSGNDIELGSAYSSVPSRSNAGAPRPPSSTQSDKETLMKDAVRSSRL
mmetsp:Transcript_18688/g.31106  ORF Transcript_18688/g.31106 Transcript_18688/m.31106 type:complete len:755 (+) Transcript_18688:110-2374(+)|eukprot:CAMPEP_0184343438 /NCGR_PEP_ID=MMETSP1089-20130417/11964_1 /TAXON_ID=38269 ORGANISM="Gloeochaete wittrockiana, Strain SAG46.84" /NCGR_SAMPLE_ID=MMETSP1089 /ASSEMBLY_ACC=CAM_ASM_000445 /LENGTH=754 /DNA_ID=CAMNT_0026672733 /DNA_START=89 /DNA_END=2353 /DNA_ORIENTATION=+